MQKASSEVKHVKAVEHVNLKLHEVCELKVLMHEAREILICCSCHRFDNLYCTFYN